MEQSKVGQQRVHETALALGFGEFRIRCRWAARCVSRYISAGRSAINARTTLANSTLCESGSTGSTGSANQAEPPSRPAR